MVSSTKYCIPISPTPLEVHRLPSNRNQPVCHCSGHLPDSSSSRYRLDLLVPVLAESTTACRASQLGRYSILQSWPVRKFGCGTERRRIMLWDWSTTMAETRVIRMLRPDRVTIGHSSIESSDGQSLQFQSRSRTSYADGGTITPRIRSIPSRAGQRLDARCRSERNDFRRTFPQPPESALHSLS